MKIELSDEDVVEVEGLRFTGAVIKTVLNNPPADCVFSVKREGDLLRFTSYGGMEAVAEFYANLKREGESKG